MAFESLTCVSDKEDQGSVLMDVVMLSLLAIPWLGLVWEADIFKWVCVSFFKLQYNSPFGYFCKSFYVRITSKRNQKSSCGWNQCRSRAGEVSVSKQGKWLHHNNTLSSLQGMEAHQLIFCCNKLHHENISRKNGRDERIVVDTSILRSKARTDWFLLFL